MIIFCEPWIERPFPRSTPRLPTPTMDLLLATLIPLRPALSHVAVMLFSLGSQVSLMVSWPPLLAPHRVWERQAWPVVEPSVPLKLNSRSMRMTRGVLSVSQVVNLCPR